jgi:hypothetical protein
LRFAPLWIGFRSKRERLADCGADRRGVSADAVEPAACFARAGRALPRIAVITASS